MRDPWHCLPIAVLLCVLFACSSDGPSEPKVGSLAVAVSGLPDGTAAVLHLAGPEGYTRDLTGSETLAALTPGAYTVTAAGVTSGSVDYTPVPTAQTVNVAAGSAAAAHRCTTASPPADSRSRWRACRPACSRRSTLSDPRFGSASLPVPR